MSDDFYTPTAVANEALDAAGLDFTLGDIQEGTRPAQVVLRKYNTCLEQMLRTAGWNFARKQAPLLLLADATGQTPDVGTIVPGTWTYEYALPTDCARFRYIPWNPYLNPYIPPVNIQPSDPGAPVMENINNVPASYGGRVIPARFLVTTDTNYIPPGANNDTPGISPIGRTVVLTNVRFAQGIYTYKATWPNLWDAQFRAAMVAFLAAEIVMPLATDKRFGTQMRAQNIAIAQDRIKKARVSDGLEGWHSSDLSVDWMRFRNSGGYGFYYSWMANMGDWSCQWDGIGGGTGNSSAY